jgi:hypothetical protein
MCILEGEDDLSDFMVEIDILSECRHENIVQLYEAYFTNSKLWVSPSIFFFPLFQADFKHALSYSVQ